MRCVCWRIGDGRGFATTLNKTVETRDILSRAFRGMLNRQMGCQRPGRGGGLEVHELGVVAQGAVGGCCSEIDEVWGLITRDPCGAIGGHA